MGKYVGWINHRGKSILFVNASGLKEREYLAALEELKQERAKLREAVPVLIDLSRTPMTAATTEKGKEVAAASTASGVPEGPVAMVGLTMLARAVAQMFRRGTHYTDSLEEAKEWLVREDERRQRK